MFNSRSLIDLAFICNVCDQAPTKICVWFEVGVKSSIFDFHSYIQLTQHYILKRPSVVY